MLYSIHESIHMYIIVYQDLDHKRQKFGSIVNLSFNSAVNFSNEHILQVV